MNYENEFYREISEIPDLPQDLFPAINRRLHRRSLMRKSLYVLAASLIAAIGITTSTTIHSSENDGLQPEVASELQIIHDYLNSSDLESDLAMYAVVEGY